jgi:S-adenosylmethionine:tRNA ribosyltransferase-isomerase
VSDPTAESLSSVAPGAVLDPNRLSYYDFELPKELIAQIPVPRRDDSRLMFVQRNTQSIDHHHVRDLPQLLKTGDLLVLNDTRVIPAKLVGFRTSTGGRWHGLFISADDTGIWRVLGKTRGKLVPGDTVTLQDREGSATCLLRMISKLDDGSWLVVPDSVLPWSQLLEQFGRIPLPHYIRDGNMTDSDRKDYQTVFAAKPGSVAAPTAGLHFTKELIGRLVDAGIAITRVTLHVGIGTFKPITVEEITKHQMHAEWGNIDDKAVTEIARCHERGGRLIAVGTTATRLLETQAMLAAGRPWQGTTDLFIRPGHTFRALQGLMTNFHLPRSTLLVLVRTFGGDALIQRAYELAVRERYRFFSYGDAMLIV